MSTVFKGQGTIKGHVFFGVGHGGKDPGAVAFNLRESDLNLQAALYAKDVCVAHGVTVTMSRIKDEDDDLSEEIREANASGASLAVDFHTNAGGGDGFEVYHTIHGGTGKTLAQNIEAEVKAAGQNSRGLKTKKNSSGSDYFGFIRSIAVPSIIVEMAFIDKWTDIQDWNDPAELKKYGTAVAKGVLKTLGISYKAGSTSSATSNTTGTFYRVIAGSYTVRANAEAMQKKLKAAGFNTFLAAYTINNTNYLRVVVGSYASRANAEAQVATLKAKGFSSFLVPYKM